ncbi:adenosine deaminase-like isoform X1 [Rhincodon typus]|uniref:adenosine deaminase-like isoform X1 n=1 Tax=Rhincodon typus TaxID=259920 RepID=UPI0009A28333|nr:adenosine deaminase-like isoform X1 [Rhincodon typus]
MARREPEKPVLQVLRMAGVASRTVFTKPKVELHCHLDGAIRLKTILHFAKKRKIQIPAENEDELRKLVTCSKPSTLTEVLSKFRYYMPVIAGDREAIEQIAYELAEDKAKEGIVYLEARYSPHYLANCNVHPIPWGQTEGNVSPDEVVHLVNQGFLRGQCDFGIKVRSILCCIRHMEAWSLETVELCKKYRNDGVVGIDLAGDELMNAESHPGHVQAYEIAVKCGIHRTVHAGEAGPPPVVCEALEILKSERIGHGYAIINDPVLYKEILQKKIHIEACPYSSVLTGACDPDFTKHPVVTFKKDKANFSLNTDDPLVFGSTIHTDYNIAADYMNFTERDFMEMNLNAAASSFLCPKEKEELLNFLKTEYGMRQDFCH